MIHQNRKKVQDRILSRFEFNLPFRPYCTNDKERGIWYTDKEQALLCRYIQPNFGTHSYIMLDIDSDNVWWYDCDLPEPTIRTTTKENGKSHWLYELQHPVFVWKNRARSKPIEYLNNITLAMTIQAETADLNYTGLLTKNPCHQYWRVETWNNRYTLAELDEYIRLETRNELKIRRKQRDKAEYSSRGRNCYLFDFGRYHAYSIAIKHKNVDTLYQDVLEQINYQNALTYPGNLLPQRECEQIAWSIAKWTFPRRHNLGKGRNKTKDKGDLRQRQVKSAKTTNQKRKDKTRTRIHKAIREIEASGKKVTTAEIHRATGIAKTTIYRTGILKK